MKLIRSIFLLLTFAAALVLIGCGAHKGNFAAMKYAVDGAPMRSGDVYAAEEKSFGAHSDAGQSLPENRKLIRTGTIRFEVSSLAETKAAAEAWAKRFGGYVSDFSEDGRSLGMTVHIPSPAFDDAMSSSGAIGKVVSKSADSVDVTDRFYDLDSRLATRRVLLERLQSYLKEAKNIKDMLEIETKINDVTAEIEQMQGQFNRLSKQIDYSEIYIEANLPYNHAEDRGFIFPDLKSAFIEFCETVVGFFTGFVFVVLYIIIFGIPILCVAFLLYWICFGKIGVLRKLFAKIRAGQPHRNRASKE
ncbi:DUF4349 domain-containing protein [Treponema parvum]|uniref:DUF4349 domain-containing protein n=1 Tax=Treponema parvum TaxID=138851 RepID=A0A975F5N4_9SPIR|nr:DUF4349 domain-containing protein [Treponema parvum]QTQ14763.1 DUF4349 domain-containing protein [Treponema parvum]